MKIVASTRLSKAQRVMQTEKQYGIANSGMVISARYRLVDGSSRRGFSERYTGRGSKAQTFHCNFLRQGSLQLHPPPCFEGHAPLH